MPKREQIEEGVEYQEQAKGVLEAEYEKVIIISNLSCSATFTK